MQPCLRAGVLACAPALVLLHRTCRPEAGLGVALPELPHHPTVARRPPPPALVLRQVSAAATAAMLAAFPTAGNRDLEPHIPALVSCIAQPGEVPAVIAKLSATTFVQVGG